ncbi:MAG: hydroxyacylglutathione hydrolase [Pseudomonadota bacterium]
MLKVIPIPAFKDNYIWLLVNPSNHICAIVDPGDAAPVIEYLINQKLTPCAILITHHHHDHTGGIPALCEKFPELVVYGPKYDAVANIDYKLGEGDRVSLVTLDIEFRVIDIPGHTRGHIAYYGDDMLFCGDTLFAAGCGRLFEGTAQQMVESLGKLAKLPVDTRVYCAHEYTAANLRFAAVVEPDNEDIAKRAAEINNLRENNAVTLPSLMSIEKLTNPFLRCDINSVVNSVRDNQDVASTDLVSIFQALRIWKDNFR